MFFYYTYINYKTITRVTQGNRNIISTGHIRILHVGAYRCHQIPIWNYPKRGRGLRHFLTTGHKDYGISVWQRGEGGLKKAKLAWRHSWLPSYTIKNDFPKISKSFLSAKRCCVSWKCFSKQKYLQSESIRCLVGL